MKNLKNQFRISDEFGLRQLSLTINDIRIIGNGRLAVEYKVEGATFGYVSEILVRKNHNHYIYDALKSGDIQGAMKLFALYLDKKLSLL